MTPVEPITVAVITGFIIGLSVGAVIAVLAMMEHPLRHWVVCLRLPEELHRRLREKATDHKWSLKAEIISRLQASFSQPNGDQVVDAPGL
jgi:Arc-like DNA binding domain